MKPKSKANKGQRPTGVAVRRVVRLPVLARQIAEELMTMNFGTSMAKTVERIALMKETPNGEKDLGGRCRWSVEGVILKNLKKARRPNRKKLSHARPENFMKPELKADNSQRPTGVAVRRVVRQQFTPGQRALVKKHGTPADFAIACYMCVPSDISMDEAEAASQKYRREFLAA